MKKLISILLALVLVIGLAACGGLVIGAAGISNARVAALLSGAVADCGYTGKLRLLGDQEIALAAAAFFMIRAGWGIWPVFAVLAAVLAGLCVFTRSRMYQATDNYYCKQ